MSERFVEILDFPYFYGHFSFQKNSQNGLELIKAYSLNLKPKNGNYVDKVTFEQLVELYLFKIIFTKEIKNRKEPW